MHFIPLSCRIAMTKTSNIVLNRNGENNHPYLVVDFRGKAFSFAPLSEMLAMDLTSVQFSRSVKPDSLWLRGLRHARLPSPLPVPRTCLNSCPSSRWCHPTISSSVVPFFSCLQSFPASGSWPMTQFFESGGQIIGASASAAVLPMNIQDSYLLGLTGLMSLQSKGLSRAFSNTTVQKHQFLSAQLSLWSNSHIHTWLL